MGKVAAFIDDVIIGIKGEEGHDELVAEVIKRKWSICKTGKVQVKSERSRILRSSNWSRRDKDGRGEDKGCIRLADTKVHQGYTEVFGVTKLLLLIYWRLHIYS